MSKLTTHQRKARDLMQREDWDGALSELQRVLGMDANNPTLHNQIGDVYLRKGDIDQACDHFEMAVDLYSNLSLHNNAVALCRKVVRLAPTRVEVRYNLARLRMDQGLRSDATAAFVDYLDHAQPDDDEAADALEQRCVDVVESFPDIAPVGQILEKLEAVQRPQGAYKIVQRAAKRAADTGDTAAANRFTEKMRSLKVLLESQGASGDDIAASSVDPSAVDLDTVIPDEAVAEAVDLPVADAAPSLDPAAIDLPDVGVPEAADVSAAAPPEIDIPTIDLPDIDADTTAVSDTAPPAVDVDAVPEPVDEPAPETPAVAAASEVDVAEEGSSSEEAVPEIDLDDSGSLGDTVAELQDVLQLEDPPAVPEVEAAPEDSVDEASVEKASVDDTEQPEAVDEAAMPEYELPETSLEEVANLLQQEGVEPTEAPQTEAPEDAAPTAAQPQVTPELLVPETPEEETATEVTMVARDDAAEPIASIAETFADPPPIDEVETPPAAVAPAVDAAPVIPELTVDAPAEVADGAAAMPVPDVPVNEVPAAQTPVVEAPVADTPVVASPAPEGPVVETSVVDNPVAEAPAAPAPAPAEDSVIPELDPEDRPASVVYEPAPESRRPAGDVGDTVRRQPVWIPGPNTESVDPTPSEDGQTQELEEVIDTFREQMARALGDDGAARYDLGVAYYDMGLYNEALAEFEVAVKCPGLATRTLEMMASCLAQEGRHDEIVSLLEGPLSEAGDGSADRLALQYAMGLALEAVGQVDEARRHFEEVALVDIGFKDVQSRLQR